MSEVALTPLKLALTTILMASCLTCHSELVPVTVGWRFKVGAPVSLPPILSGSVIYAVSGRAELIALNLDGTKRWTTALPQQPLQELFSTPPLCVNNTLLAGTDKGTIHAFDAGTGSFKWKVKIGEDIYGPLNWQAPEGTNDFTALALSRNNGSLVRIELTAGRLIWASKPVGRSDGSPAVGNGFIVFGACDAALHFISPLTGTVRAITEFNELGPMAGGTALDGPRVYAGTRDGSVLCADATTFKLVWTNQVASSEIFTTPALTSNRVLAGSGDGFVYCLNRASGNQLWKAATQGSPHSPVVAGNTVVVSSGGTLSILSMEDGRTLWSDKPCDTLSPPVLADGKIIVGTDDGFIILYQHK